VEVDPAQLARTLETEPDVLADLKRIDLGSVKEIVAAFLASPDVLARATSMSPPVTDDRPLQEHSMASVLATESESRCCRTNVTRRRRRDSARR
jgi:hypothetical protein